MGEGEFGIFMKTIITIKLTSAPPPIALFNWGRLGRGSNNVMKDMDSVIRAIMQVIESERHS
jgi:hypothetical protein